MDAVAQFRILSTVYCSSYCTYGSVGEGTKKSTFFVGEPAIGPAAKPSASYDYDYYCSCFLPHSAVSVDDGLSIYSPWRGGGM